MSSIGTISSAFRPYLQSSTIREYGLASTPKKILDSFDLVPYLRLSTEELTNHSEYVRTMLTLLNTNLAPYFARLFIVGNTGMHIYGQPLVMMTQSKTVANTAEDITNIGSNNISILLDKNINQGNAAAFVAVWMMLNGLFPLDWLSSSHGKSRYSLQDIIYMLGWMSYFDVRVDFDGYMSVQQALIDRLKDNPEISAAERKSLQDLYQIVQQQCAQPSRKSSILCNNITLIISAAGGIIGRSPEVRSVETKLARGQTLTPAEEELTQAELKKGLLRGYVGTSPEIYLTSLPPSPQPIEGSPSIQAFQTRHFGGYQHNAISELGSTLTGMSYV